MAENISAFQAGREAAMCGGKRDRRMSADWLEGYDSEAAALQALMGGVVDDLLERAADAEQRRRDALLNALNLPANGPYSAKTGD